MDKTAILKQIPLEDTARNLAYYIGETIVPKRRLIATVESGGWKISAAQFIIVDNQKVNIIGRNILPQIGVKLIQEKPKQRDVLNILEQVHSNPEIKQWVKDNYPLLCIRIGKPRDHVMRTQFNQDFIPVQQKRRRNPVQLQERVEIELSKLMDQKHIIKLDKCSD